MKKTFDINLNPIIEDYTTQLLGQSKSSIEKIYQKEWRAAKPLLIREIATILVQGNDDSKDDPIVDSNNNERVLNYDEYMQEIKDSITPNNKNNINNTEIEKFETYDIDKEKLKILSDKIEEIEIKLTKLGKKGRPSKRENPFIN